MDKDFHHPFKPYEIQMQFMSALYECIEQGKGKSLSLICGALTWLRDYKRKKFEDGFGLEGADDDEPEWILEHARAERRQAARRRRADLEARLAKIRMHEKKAKEQVATGGAWRKKPKVAESSDSPNSDADDRFLLEDYESETEAERESNYGLPSNSGISAKSQALMEKLGMYTHEKKVEELEQDDELKIFYCSRTHSQLSQFVNELRRVKLPPSLREEQGPNGTEGASTGDCHEEIKHLTLGSRKNLCINQKVSRLGNVTAINEKCLELQQPGTPANLKCPYLPTSESEAPLNDFRDHTLAKIRDIEDMGALGRKIGICPYYASRQAIKSTEIVTLPYPLMLQKSSREILNISLKDHVVIIDEAHNLLDAIVGVYSTSVSLLQLQRARAQLGAYLQKFKNRLKGKNRAYVAQTVRLIDSLVTCLRDLFSKSSTTEAIVQISDLMAGKGADQINLYQLNRYLQRSKLARKVDSYTLSTNELDQRTTQVFPRPSKDNVMHPEVSIPVLTHIQSFLLSLMNPSAEGRFFYSRGENQTDTILKYMLLDPRQHFRDIVEEARAVILSGGTMSPMSDYTNHLLSYMPSSQMMTLSCGHVISASSLFACPLMKGPSGKDLQFTFEKRNSVTMMEDVGDVILSLLHAIPDGVVVFFPSYAYLEQCVNTWKRSSKSITKSGASSTSLWDSLSNHKRVFLETKSSSRESEDRSDPIMFKRSSAEKTLSDYAAAVASGDGGLLLAVVGGSLSEGINFSDALGRAVIVVGLPFPNAQSAEWKAKLEYITHRDPNSIDAGKTAAREFYENACMRAVNQCIGRAIRHRGDYAAILLMDTRYNQERIKGKLPGWIQASLKEGGDIQTVVDDVRTFFMGKKNLNEKP